MRLLILVAVFGVGIIYVTAKPATYTDKFDNVNLDEILESDRLLKGYIDCLLERGRCTPDAKTLKDILPDALASDCSKCTEKQKKGSDKVIRYLVNKRPEMWKELGKKYDPDNIYQDKFKDKIAQIKQ